MNAPMPQIAIDSAPAIVERLSRDSEVARGKPRRAEGVLDSAPFIVLRNGDREEVVCLLGTMPSPHRKTGTVKLNDADSFIWYYGQHGNGAPVYATLEPARFVAVLNEHTKDAAGWRDHRAEFRVAHSKEWTIWSKHNGQGAAFNSNEAFATFLEENSPDIIKPDAAVMLAIALNFKMTSDVQFQTATRLQDGNIDFGYANIVSAEAKTAAGNKVKIPELFSIELPVFDGLTAPRYKLEARFRYRLREGKLTLWYELVRPHKVIEQAFKDVWAQIAKATKAPILHGTPE
jgi:uncharacterized protein YfdQ (DUF2303 family)